MSQDGANLNMKADAAVEAVLGGEEPERMTDEAFEQMIRSATIDGSGDYGGCANRAARLVLEYLEQHPDVDGSTDRQTFYESLKASVSEQDRREVLGGLTGFMWGWAVNAARHILKRQSVPNPAIVEIDV